MNSPEQQLRAILDTIRLLVWSAQPNGSIHFVNQFWQSYTGLGSDSARDWRWTAAVHPDDLEQNVASWRSILASGEPGQRELRLRRDDGQYR